MSNPPHFPLDEPLERQPVPWTAVPEVREYVNGLIGDGEGFLPLEWFQRWLGGRRFAHALSIGCGTGDFDRQLIAHGLAERIDSFDASALSLQIAQHAAASEGLGDRIRYFEADPNEATLPDTRYDLVCLHHSAHRIGRLEELFRAVLRVLEPEGLVYLDGYIGPSRDAWSDELLAAPRAEYAAIAPELRLTADLPHPITEGDPSEAIRSGDIESRLRLWFDVVARRPYGGTLLSLVLPRLRVDRLTHSQITGLIDAERVLLAGGTCSYYAVIVAKPKRGLAKTWARLRYGLARDLRARLRRRTAEE
jgi:SAM-dependent methyltransferase